MNLITGFVKPSSGEIRYRENTLPVWPPYKIVGRGIARTFQMVRPFYQLPAFKNLIVPLYSPRVKKLAGGKYGDRDAVALDLLEEVGFERDAHVSYKVAGSLPQGYLKRLELAKSMALRPDLIILDELFSGLSLAEVASIVPIIEKLRVQGKTIIMIEHRLKELVPHCRPGDGPELWPKDRRRTGKRGHGKRRSSKKPISVRRNRVRTNSPQREQTPKDSFRGKTLLLLLRSRRSLWR